MPKNPTDYTTSYAKKVVCGKIITGQYVKLACERHLKDLEKKDFAYYFDVDRANKLFKFYGLFNHYKGEWAGQPIKLELWQKFIIGCIYGWKRKDGYRRFRNAYIEVARKNGKSTVIAPLGLYGLGEEDGAECYSAATKRDQAKIVFEASKQMIKTCSSPQLKSLVQVFKSNISIVEKGSKYEPLSRDSKTMDGFNTSLALIDELHAHESREVYDVLDTSTSARIQPLMISITTAGYDRHSICWEHHQYSLKVLDGTYDDEAANSWFAYIASIDEGDDWRDESVWIKANPNLGVSVKLDDLRLKAMKAQDLPAAQNAFRQKHCNEWVEQSERWIDMHLWDKGAGNIDQETLKGRRCYAGLDLARVSDLTALALLFPPDCEKDKWKLLMRFWCPEDDIIERSRKDKVPYIQWRDEEYIIATPGNTTDFNWIEQQIIKLHGEYNIREVSYDRMFAGEIVNNLTDEGVKMVPYGQGYLSMSPPTAELERMLKGEIINHGGHPILRWNASNIVIKRDPAGNMKPDKEKAIEKIDGIVALLNALGRAMVCEGTGKSVYEERGIIVL